MKYFLLILVLAGAAWNWHSRNTLDDKKIVALYTAQGEAWQKQDAAALCDQIADDFEGKVRTMHGMRSETETVSKQASCEGAEAILDLKAEVDKGMPEGQQLGWTYRFTIRSIDISDDKKSAEVSVATHLNMGNLLVIDSDGTDTVELRKGKLVFTAGEATAKFSGVMGNAMNAAAR